MIFLFTLFIQSIGNRLIMNDDVVLAFTAVEKWLFLPCGYHYLWFTSDALHVLFIDKESPGQAYRSVGQGHRGWKGSVSHSLGSKLAERVQSRVEPKIKELDMMDVQTALASSKHNYTVPAYSVERLRGEYMSGEETLDLYLDLNDSSGLWPFKGRRKFTIESEELGDIVSDIRNCCPFAVDL